MRFVRTLVVLFGMLLLMPAMAAVEARAGCDSCRMQITSLEKPIKLTGKWLFTRDDNPVNKDVQTDTTDWRLVTTPGPWKSVYGDGKNFRVGWYRGVFEFDPSLVGQEVVLLVDAYMGKVNLFVDGTEIYKRPGEINIERYYSIQPIPVRFKVTQAQHVVAIRVDTWLMTGIYQLPFEMRKFDSHDASLAWYQFRGGEARVIVGCVVLFFGFFFLLVYKKTRYNLYLVAAAMSIVVFPFFVAPSDMVLRVFSPDSMLFLHYIGLYMFFFAYVFCQFFYKFTPKFNWVMGSVYAVMAVTLGTMTLHPNLDLFQKARTIFFATSLVWGVLSMYQSFRGMMLKKPGAAVLFVGMVIFFIAGIHDMLLALGKIQSTSLLFTGVSSFIASMLYVASSIFANTFLENKRLVGDLKGINDNLENIVSERTMQLRQKTNDIQTMLQNMPQGILTLVDGGVVHPEYSAYLEEIFETKDISGRKSMDLIFTGTNLGADTLSQVDAIAGACIGEDKMNFEFNTHLMVTEFEKTMPSGKVKSLELSWSPIANENDVVDKLMICVRDVTELKQLAAEAGQQKRELEMIGQVLAVNQEKFHEFIDSSLAFVGENKDLIERANGKEVGVISHLFRNMHTIKGNARTFGLLQLANIVHEAEQTYDDMRKSDAVQWDSTHLLAQLKATHVAIEEYAKINEIKLGRKGPGRRGGVDKFLMVQKDHIEGLIQGFDRLDRTNAAAVNEVLRQVQNTLRQIGSEKISDTLAGVMDSLPSLARELGKEAPQITIKDNGILVKNQIADLLRNVFMHLLRNSMDHGIEAAEKRVAQGKTPVGHINLELFMQDGKMVFSLRDDGRGLAVGIIRRKAIESGLITEDAVISQESVAQLIFESGFSTAEQVTEISGRGVGMDAVKGFLEREGGSIELRFTADAVAGSAGDFRPFETVISLPEKFAVKLAF